MIARQRGFSIVEALVATILVGVASTLLASALTVRTVARRGAARDAAAAGALGDLLRVLAARPCLAADTSAESTRETAMGKADVRWHARRAGAGWAFAESVSVRLGSDDGRSVVATEGRVPCT
ncbi:MAG: type II secretion system protein [Gemmatimonadota bacterium]|nr:type II secretion system protein [Gemmatimonadota bacterium]